VGSCRCAREGRGGGVGGFSHDSARSLPSPRGDTGVDHLFGAGDSDDDGAPVAARPPHLIGDGLGDDDDDDDDDGMGDGRGEALGDDLGDDLGVQNPSLFGSL
jgi:hypothetical protein